MFKQVFAKSAVASLLLVCAAAANATVITITHNNNPSNVSSYGYIYFNHNNAFDTSLGQVTALELDMRVYDVDRSTNLQARIGGSWTTVGSFGTGPSVWRWYNVGLGANVIAQLQSAGSLRFRFNEGQSSNWRATYDRSRLTIDYTTAVPEPGSLGLAFLGGIGLLLARRLRRA